MADTDTLLDAFNNATSDADILAAIEANASTLLNASDLAKLNALPDGGGRLKAIGLGVEEVRDLFGAFKTVADLKTVVAYEVAIEHAKHLFITALDGATTPEAMAAAIKETLGQVAKDRADLIEAWDEITGNEALADRVADLKADPYTTALAEIVKHLDDAAYMAELSAQVLEARNNLPGGKFFGVVKIADALEDADAAIHEAALLDAFNDASGWADALAAIKTNAADLGLSQASLDHLEALPDDAGREQAIGLGVNEIKKLFGAFETVEQITAAVEKQIAVEYAKHEFITAVATADDAEAMAAALGQIKGLSDAREALITEWSKNTDQEVMDRVADLKVDPYTTVLAEIASKLDDENYVAELAAQMLAARQANGPFYGVGSLVTALDAANEYIDASPLVEVDMAALGEDGTSTVTISFSKEPVGFDPDEDLEVEGGTLSDLVADASGKVFTGTFTPNDNYEGVGKVAVKAGSYTDTMSKPGAGDSDELTVDTKTPALAIDSVEGGDNTINAAEAADGIILTGTVEADATVKVNGVVATVTGSTWTVTLPAPGAEGSLNVKVVATDAAGNETIVSEILLIDTVAPDVGTLEFDNLVHMDADRSDGITNDKTFDLTLDEYEDDALVVYQVSKDGGEWLTTTAAQKDLDDGEYRFRAVVTDLAGNSSTSDVISVTIDATSKAPVVNGISADSGSSVSDRITNVKEQGISGTAEADSMVLVILVGNNGKEYQFETAADEDGNWELPTTGELPDGTYMVTALSSDRAGNLRATTSPYSFTVDTRGANAVSIAMSDTVLKVGDQSIVTVAFSERVANLQASDFVVENGTLSGLSSSDGGLTWTGTFTPSTNIEDAFNAISVKDTFKDLAGNTGTGIVGGNYFIDTKNDAPIDIGLSNAAVAEAAAKGSVVGTLTAVDWDPEETFTFTLLDTAGGRFALNGNQLVVANGSALDFEQARSHKIAVQVTDRNGAIYVEEISIGVTDVTVEKVVGSSGNDTVKGGNSGDNLSGGSGNDYLYGGLGKDILTGGKGKDSFVFNTKLDKKKNVDTIKDFNVKDDTIRLENKIFKKLTKTGKLNKDFFTIGTKAKDKNDYIIYDNKSGALYYDADGSGKGGAVKFAQLSKNLKMTYADFVVI